MTQHPPQPLLDTIEDALALLQTYRGPTLPLADTAEPLPGLLQQCEALTRRSAPPQVRSIHHFACTGGSLLSNAVAAQANVVLLNEIDPLSPLNLAVEKPAFTPHSVIQQLRYSRRGNSDPLIEEVFVREVIVMRDHLARLGQTLVIRDHTHSQYCLGTRIASRPTLLDMLRKTGDSLAVVTVRHPLDSYLSLVHHHRLAHFSPATLQEYAGRYLGFLEDYSVVPLFRFEDFISAPERTISGICSALNLPFDADAVGLSQLFAREGDRNSVAITARPRRPVPPDVAAETTAPAYLRLCERLGYPPVS